MFQDSEGDDEGEEEVEDEGEEEQQESDSHALTNDVGKSNLPILSVPREPERQLSKKELKKKELAELDAVLLELGLTPKEENGCASSPSTVYVVLRFLRLDRQS